MPAAKKAIRRTLHLKRSRGMTVIPVTQYSIVLSPEPEGGFTVTVPALPGCITNGKDLESAKRNAREAIECHPSLARRARKAVGLSRHLDWHEPSAEPRVRRFESV
jgi:hypothetical protein